MHKVFTPTIELLIPTGTATNEVNAELETQPETVKVKTSKSST